MSYPFSSNQCCSWQGRHYALLYGIEWDGRIVLGGEDGNRDVYAQGLVLDGVPGSFGDPPAPGVVVGDQLGAHGQIVLCGGERADGDSFDGCFCFLPVGMAEHAFFLGRRDGLNGRRGGGYQDQPLHRRFIVCGHLHRDLASHRMACQRVLLDALFLYMFYHPAGHRFYGRLLQGRCTTKARQVGYDAVVSRQEFCHPLPAQCGAAKIMEKHQGRFVFFLFLHRRVILFACSRTKFFVNYTGYWATAVRSCLAVLCLEDIQQLCITIMHMKHQLFYFVVMAFLTGGLHAQTSDTALSGYYRDTTSWEYKMETSDEHWGRLAKRTDYQLFHRYQWNGPKVKNRNTGNVGFYGNGTLFWLNDIDEVEMAATGVTQQNAGEFIYHVVENDSIEIVPWTSPHNFRTNNKITYAYLGKFSTKNRIVRLEFYNLRHYYDRSMYTFNDLFLPKAQLKHVALFYNNKYLFRPHQQHFIPINKQHYYSEENLVQVTDSAGHTAYKRVIRKLKKGDISFSWSDSINHIEVQIDRTLQNDLYNVYLKKTIDGKTDTVYISNDWTLSYYSPRPGLRISSSYFNKPGEYEIIVVPELPDEFKRNTMDKALTIPFTVLPSGIKTFTSAQLAMIIGACLLAFGIIFVIYRILHKRKLAREAQQKEIARLQLQSVRSQLNPHFMFNALAGIQNLMNKNDVDATNRYLNKFARLTRNVLEDKKDGMVDIAEEHTLLETYLQMEQMRFGFGYDIQVEEGIDKDNTEIPAMLLQPFVENAVKHGVSSLNGEGYISIMFRKRGEGLLIEIKDNGKGYQHQGHATGNGTRLSQERIDLLNRLHKETPITLHRKSDLTGTTISIQLNGYIHAFHDH